MVYDRDLKPNFNYRGQVHTQERNQFVFGQKPDGIVMDDKSLIYIETQITCDDTQLHYGKCVSYAGNLNLQPSSAETLAVFYISTFFDHFHLIEINERNKVSRVKIIPIKIEHNTKSSSDYDIKLTHIKTVAPDIIEAIRDDLLNAQERVLRNSSSSVRTQNYHQILKVEQPLNEVDPVKKCLPTHSRNSKKINYNKNFEKIGEFLGRILSIYHFRAPLQKGGKQWCYHMKKSDCKEMIKKQHEILEKYPISISLLKDSLKSQIPLKTRRFGIINSAICNLGIAPKPCLYQVNYGGSDLIHEMISLDDAEKILTEIKRLEHIMIDTHEILFDLLCRTEFLRSSLKEPNVANEIITQAA